MRPFRSISAKEINQIKYVLCDIDDTLTTGGKLPAASYSALWELHNMGIKVIPVTGRPAGWCDLIVRQWPVSAVIGENGAFTYYMESGHLKTLTHPEVNDNAKEELKAIEQAALKQVPQARISKDQFSRKYDLAIDFREDPPYLSFDEADKIQRICTSMGAEAKVSSIHVNAWFGKYDKVDMARITLNTLYKESDPLNTVLFFGDSPNDEPMFKHFPLSCAVANIGPFISKLTHLPQFVTEHEGGEGFAEAIALIVSSKL